ncbi:hypothetical protein MKZ38_007761 [Zalerion maritima]|uniref:rhamnogalacturonan endolyase n=1 Tax=Zalerion maritima TaxID=339359 RepID=A0AAD5RWQ8_9PEZI|nr:hypothetical protein MKZ38_007761 [Zalerion maritima]
MLGTDEDQDGAFVNESQPTETSFEMKLSLLLASAAALASSAFAAPATTKKSAAYSRGHGGGSSDATPFFTTVDNTTWIIGNGVWNMTQGYQYGIKLWYKGRDCVGDAWGHYVSYNGAASDLAWLSASISSSGTYKGTKWLDVEFNAAEGDMHWVIFAGQHGAYQYFVNHDLPTLGEFRTLWRLDNTTFTHGHTDILDEALPPLEWYIAENKVQDETWSAPEGVPNDEEGVDMMGYITKYDWTSYLRDQVFYGVYGEEVGSWYINPGKDYYGGDTLKQELMVHRESATGDAVQLNMIHGTHFQAASSDDFPDGKMWGPWLWYLNDGSKPDAEKVARQEFAAWPYSWFEDADYQSRGTVKGRLRLSDGRAAAGATVFLGDNEPNKTTLDMGTDYYYTTTANSGGYFQFEDVRSGTYGLQAWSAGGKLADVNTVVLQNDVEVAKGKTTNLGKVEWEVSSKVRLFQVGDFDRKGLGFQYGGYPYTHALSELCPENITYAAGQSNDEEWCFVQARIGSWSISFTPSRSQIKKKSNDGTATLIVSIAGYSAGASSEIIVNGETVVGDLTSGMDGLANDQSVYRSCTEAGEWRYLEFEFDSDLINEGGKNEVTFHITRQTTWHGFLWDAIALEW